MFAAPDLGTNNCRLLIAQPTGSGCVIDDILCIVRLGEGVSEAGALSDAFTHRTVEALGCSCQQDVAAGGYRRHGAHAHKRRGPLEIVRISVSLVKRETGIDMEIITSREEAELTLTGCFSLLDPAYDHALMFDVGGGSAEFVWKHRKTVAQRQWMMSLPCGVVTLTELHEKKNLLRRNIENLIAGVVETLRPFDPNSSAFPNISRGAMSRWSALRAQSRPSREWRCPCRVTTDPALTGVTVSMCSRTASRCLSGQSYEERAAHPCIGYNRADLVVAAAPCWKQSGYGR